MRFSNRLHHAKACDGTRVIRFSRESERRGEGAVHSLTRETMIGSRVS